MAPKKTHTEPQPPIDWEKRRDQDLKYTGRALLACSLPLKPEKITVLERGQATKRFASKYVRESGPYRVKILADESYGIPYGKDRLFLYWLITQVVRSKQKTVYYSSVRKLLESIGLSYGQTNRRWLREAIDRIMNSTIFLEYADGHVHGIEKDTVLRKVVGALDPKLKKGTPYTDCYFELSSDFYRELVENSHAIPFDMEIIRRLGEDYGTMDFYVWWNYKIWTLKNSELPYFSINSLALQNQFSGAKNMPCKKYRQQLKGRVRKLNRVIKEVYGIDPKLELLSGRLSFKVLTLTNHIELVEDSSDSATQAPIERVMHEPSTPNPYIQAAIASLKGF